MGSVSVMGKKDHASDSQVSPPELCSPHRGFFHFGCSHPFISTSQLGHTSKGLSQVPRDITLAPLQSTLTRSPSPNPN